MQENLHNSHNDYMRLISFISKNDNKKARY